MKKFLLLLFIPIQMFAAKNDDALIDYMNSWLQLEITEINEAFEYKKLLVDDEEKLQFYFKGKLDAYYECLIYLNHLFQLSIN